MLADEEEADETNRRELHACAGAIPLGCREWMWANGASNTGRANDTFLMNGQPQEAKPTHTLRANAWYRIRMVFVSVGGTDFLPAIKGCEVKLLAKDGIYLPVTPRDMDDRHPIGYLGASNRADWLVRCAAPGTYHLNYTLDSSPMYGRYMTTPKTLATFTVADAGDAPVAVRPFKVSRPCYLVDLLDVKPDESHEINFLGMAGMYNETGQKYMQNGQ